MRSQRNDRRNARRHVVSRGLQLDQLSDSAKQAYEQRQQRRVSQYSDLQLVMDELFIPERDALETEDEEEESEDDRSPGLLKTRTTSTLTQTLSHRKRSERAYLYE